MAFDSFVRVSRRAYESRFGRITKVPQGFDGYNSKRRQAGKSKSLFTEETPILPFGEATASVYTCRRNPQVAASHSFLLNGFKSFNLFFKVLFTFPSQYLFAIGFPSIFSFRRSLSPILGWSPKQPDSKKVCIRRSATQIRGFHPLCRSVPGRLMAANLLLRPPRDYNSPTEGRRFTV